MADLAPLHAVTVVWRPADVEHPVSVLPVTVLDPLTPAQQVALLRRAAMHLADAYGLNGADCLAELLATTNEGTPS